MNEDAAELRPKTRSLLAPLAASDETRPWWRCSTWTGATRALVPYPAFVMGAGDVFMTVVAPAMGFVLANAMFFSGVPGMLRCKRVGQLGSFNPLPFPVVLANCIGWIIYSLYIDDYFLFFANAPGAMLGMYFTLVGYGLSPYGSALRDQIERSAMALMFALLCVTLYIGLIAADASLDHKRFTMGIFCNVVLLVYYAAPLSTIREVLAQRDSKSLYWPLALANTINGAAWFLYGVALGDPYLMAPNGVGAVLGGAQLALIARFPTKDRASPAPSAWGSQVDLLATLDDANRGENRPPGGIVGAVGAVLSRESLDGASRI